MRRGRGEQNRARVPKVGPPVFPIPPTTTTAPPPHFQYVPPPPPPQLRRKRDSYPSLPPSTRRGNRGGGAPLSTTYVLAHGRWGEKIMVNLFFSREGCLIWGRRRYNKAPPNLRHIHALASTQTPFSGSPPSPSIHIYRAVMAAATLEKKSICRYAKSNQVLS